MINVRRMNIDDLDRVMEIDRDCFSVPWSRETFLLELESPISTYLVAEDDEDGVIGYGGFYQVADQVEITNIAVMGRKRGKGVGKVILEGLIKLAILGDGSIVNLEVRESNIVALSLYRSYGFKEVGKRKDYYREPVESAILLTLELEKGKIDA